VNILQKRLPYGIVQEFFKEHGQLQGCSSMWITRQARALALGRLQYSGPGRGKKPSHRKRVAGGGRPYKMPPLRDELFQWFVSVRGSCAARITLGQLMHQARVLRDTMMSAAVRSGVRAHFPRIDRHWLLRWRQEYQVSLRLPNRRWKVSRAVLLERLEITWLNVIRLRRLCLLAHGYDPAMEGFDQKPMHFNESGSRSRQTLFWKGAGNVPLKEVVSQTRSRWTLNTHVTSDLGSYPELPPLEALFKGGPRVASLAEACLRRVRDDADFGPLAWFSVAAAPRGSYRKENIVKYLERHLPLMTPAREWRILMCDVFSAHMDDDVVGAALRRGYVLAFHGGGCTGVVQCNDTHLHQRLSARYQEIEMADLLEQERLQPRSCPKRDRDDCIRDAIAAWNSAEMHKRAAEGHKQNMLTET